MAENISLGDRIKSNYENRNKYFLIRRMPVIIRIDGKCFHSFAKQFDKPFSLELSKFMEKTAIGLCKEIQGAKCAYVQSDEISILLVDYDKIQSQAWFDYNVQKVASISASIATAVFNKVCNSEKVAMFDSRCFNIPKEEVCNYFIWRQQDWERNSIQMLARKYYSHKECNNKNHSDLHEMIHLKKDNWCNLEDRWKNGKFIYYNEDKKWHGKSKCPIFKDNRESIEWLI